MKKYQKDFKEDGIKEYYQVEMITRIRPMINTTDKKIIGSYIGLMGDIRFHTVEDTPEDILTIIRLSRKKEQGDMKW